jgi:cobalt/nickel transport system permease protein
LTGAGHSRGDGFAWSGSFIARIDPRVKIAGTAGLLAVNLVSHSALVSGLIALTVVVLMTAGRLPYRRQLLFIAFPASFALFAIISQAIFNGETVMFSIGPIDFHSDGLVYGLYLALRIVAGGLVVVLLGATTPLNRLCLALRWFRVPATFVELVQMTYRYLFDTYAEFSRMRQAQRARLGYSSARAGLTSSRMLGGALFLRVYDRGTRSADAMLCRGAGPLESGPMPAMGRIDAVAAVVISALLAVLLYLSISGVGS